MVDRKLERRILFYRADIGVDDGGRPLPFDPQPAIDAIANLSRVGDSADWYDLDSDGNALCLIQHSTSPNLLVRFCLVRRVGLPQIERGGNISDLNLGPDEGLLEAIHVVFFPNNIVGAEYNHFGPKVSRLGGYLHEKSNKAVRRVTFRPLLRGDAAEQLNRLSELRVLDFSIQSSYVEIVKQANDSLAAALEANRRVLEDPKILQLILKPEQGSRSRFLESMKKSLMALVGRDGVREGMERLQVRGKCRDSDRVETIDLLKDQLVSTKRIVRMNERSRALNPESAFQAIREAYGELQNQLEDAASIL